MVRGLTRRLCAARFDRRITGWTVTLRVTDQDVRIWYCFWPFSPAVVIPLASVVTVSECIFSSVLPLPAVEVRYTAADSRYRQVRLFSYRSVEAIGRRIGAGNRAVHWEHRRGFGVLRVTLMAAVILAPIAGLTLGVSGVEFLVAGVLVGNNLLYHLWLKRGN